jgi:hypothetical protein
MLFAVVLLLFGVSSAQRGNASICDYYAISNYGANSTATQYKLIQSILGLAFAGAGTLPNVSSNITGIFNPGSFEGTPVDLRPWFNASKDSTNLNDQAVAINWLDGGGTTPIYAFLTGATGNITFPNGTNEEYVGRPRMMSFTDLSPQSVVFSLVWSLPTHLRLLTSNTAASFSRRNSRSSIRAQIHGPQSYRHWTLYRPTYTIQRIFRLLRQ